jgi:hypothetical protein
MITVFIWSTHELRQAYDSKKSHIPTFPFSILLVFLFNVHVDSFLIPTLFTFSEHSLASASSLVMLERSLGCYTDAYDEGAELGDDVVGAAMISQDLAGTSTQWTDDSSRDVNSWAQTLGRIAHVYDIFAAVDIVNG